MVDQSRKTLSTFDSIFEPSFWVLLLSNGITIWFALNENWSLAVLMWIYWFQSIAIGVVNIIRILELEVFSTEGVTMETWNGGEMTLPPTKNTKHYTAMLFTFQYGVIHYVFMRILLYGDLHGLKKQVLTPDEWKYVIIMAGIFLINHLYSYFYNRFRDTRKLNLGKIMGYPYARILPMHLTAFFGGTVPVFLALKTFADVIMHMTEHKFFLNKRK